MDETWYDAHTYQQHDMALQGPSLEEIERRKFLDQVRIQVVENPTPRGCLGVALPLLTLTALQCAK